MDFGVASCWWATWDAPEPKGAVRAAVSTPDIYTPKKEPARYFARREEAGRQDADAHRRVASDLRRMADSFEAKHAQVSLMPWT